MKGQIAFSKLEVERNNMGWSIFDFFKESLKKFTTSSSAGWYAYILKDDVYYFLWCDKEDHPSQNYLNLLKKDGYNVPYANQDNGNIV